ncbi:MAG: ABC transporter ATP-binding protein [Betaproteobacteria bacterium]|nr:ABC transporter ATP-binding protein [Betaproteobacteria bacterium]NBY04254.1 ABC transporter ATP-binding protein [Betaproteobacteria bacterium]
MLERRLVLALKDLRAWYGDSQSLHGVNIEVALGEVVSIMGRNGAGKSTTLKCIMGLIEKKTGQVMFYDQSIATLSPEKISRMGLAYCPEDRGIYASLNVSENLMLPPIVAEGGFTVDEIYSLFPNLLERRSNQGTKLSGGEQQMLAIARILRTGAKLILLDEPTEGLAPVIVQKIGEVLRLLKQRGFTIILVEQSFHFVAQLADKSYIMESGRIVDRFDQAQIGQNTAKIHAYLGI